VKRSLAFCGFAQHSESGLSYVLIHGRDLQANHRRLKMLMTVVDTELCIHYLKLRQ